MTFLMGVGRFDTLFGKQLFLFRKVYQTDQSRLHPFYVLNLYKSSDNQHKNRGGSGCGIYWGEKHEESHPNPSTGHDQNTNNFAEAHAIEYALKYAIKMDLKKGN